MSNILDALGPVLGQIADLADAELEANRSALLAAAQAAGVKAIDVVAACVEDALPHGGIFLIVGPTIKAAISKAEPAVIAALGGEEAALYALADAAIKDFAHAHGG